MNTIIELTKAVNSYHKFKETLVGEAIIKRERLNTINMNRLKKELTGFLNKYPGELSAKVLRDAIKKAGVTDCHITKNPDNRGFDFAVYTAPQSTKHHKIANKLVVSTVSYGTKQFSVTTANGFAGTPTGIVLNWAHPIRTTPRRTLAQIVAKVHNDVSLGLPADYEPLKAYLLAVWPKIYNADFGPGKPYNLDYLRSRCEALGLSFVETDRIVGFNFVIYANNLKYGFSINRMPASKD